MAPGLIFFKGTGGGGGVNVIWLLLLTIGLVCGAATGRTEAVMAAAMDAARLAVEVSLGLVGVMAFWLGIAKLIEESGLLAMLVALIRPLTARLMPEVPPGDPVHGEMAMNLGANMLGLGNAATPFGIKAMRRLQELNHGRPTASRAMCTFLALNTASPCFFPSVVIALRAAAGARNPGDVVVTTLLSTGTALCAALIADRFLRERGR